MKAVIKSIKPYYVFLIYQGHKTLELSKTQPKDEDFSGKVFIYCTKDRKSLNRIPKEYRNIFEKYLGTICAEFNCDRIVIDKTFGHDPNFIGEAHLTQVEAAVYCTQRTMYGWHIEKLRFYDCDAPHPLESYYKPGTPSFENYLCLVANDKCDSESYYQYIEPFRIKAAPQSWCYVEA